MNISCAFAPSAGTPDHIAVAEALGYHHAWCFDSPALYTDVWITLALAAERTSRIGLAPGVLIPSLRHVMTNAAAIATLENLAPGRVAVGFGSGFTGREALGQKPLRWSEVSRYVHALQRLLRGETVTWEGAATRMLHLPGFVPQRPIDVPVVLAVAGPRGLAVARELGGGVWTMGVPTADWNDPWIVRSVSGTILRPGESPGDERVLAAAGHSAAIVFHTFYQRGDPQGLARLDALPGGAAWHRLIDALPAETRHLSMHEGHLVTMNEFDRQAITGDLLVRLGLVLDAATLRERLQQYAREGITEVSYLPAGPDIPGELAAFAAAAGITVQAN